MDVSTVLVAVDGPSCRLGVVMDTDGDVWLVASVDRPFGARLDDMRPEEVGLGGDSIAVGGRLPDGAVSVVVVADNGERVAGAIGDGAWVAVLARGLSGPVPPVVFRDVNGMPVAPSLPAEWPRVAVTDTDVPCPACDAVAWDEVTPLDGSRGFGGRHGAALEPSPVLVCRVCAHEERMPVMYGMWAESHGDKDEAAANARVETFRQQLLLRRRMALSAVAFPVYAVEGQPGQMAGSSSSGEHITGITVAHGADDRGRDPRLRITTEFEAPEVQDRRLDESVTAVTRHALFNSICTFPEHCQGGSRAARTLALEATRRRARLVAGRATAVNRQIPVDDQLVDFTHVQAESRWAAVGRLDALLITITGDDSTDADTLRLESAPDPATTLT